MSLTGSSPQHELNCPGVCLFFGARSATPAAATIEVTINDFRAKWFLDDGAPS